MYYITVHYVRIILYYNVCIIIIVVVAVVIYACASFACRLSALVGCRRVSGIRRGGGFSCGGARRAGREDFIKKRGRACRSLVHAHPRRYVTRTGCPAKIHSVAIPPAITETIEFCYYFSFDFIDKFVCLF